MAARRADEDPTVALHQSDGVTHFRHAALSHVAVARPRSADPATIGRDGALARSVPSAGGHHDDDHRARAARPRISSWSGWRASRTGAAGATTTRRARSTCSRPRRRSGRSGWSRRARRSVAPATSPGSRPSTVNFQAQHFMLGGGDKYRPGEGPDRQAVSDYFGMVFHGHTVTHVDSLCPLHVGRQDVQRRSSMLVDSREGALSHDVLAAKQGHPHARRAGGRGPAARRRGDPARRRRRPGRRRAGRARVRLHDRGGRRPAAADGPARPPRPHRAGRRERRRAARGRCRSCCRCSRSAASR